MEKWMNIKLSFADFSSRRFLKLPAPEVSRICEDIATKENVKVKRETYLCKNINSIDISIA